MKPDNNIKRSEETRHYLLIFAVSLLVLPLNIPLPVIERLSLWHLFVVIFSVKLLADAAVKKSPLILKPDIFFKCLLIVASFVVIRVLYDRPGSSNFGASGGLGEAVIFIIGISSFFLMRQITADINVYEKDNTAILLMAVFSWILYLVQSLISAEPFYMGIFYHSQMWMVAAFLLSMLAASALIQRNAIPWYPLFVFIFMVLATITPHRSRPLFAVANALMIGLLFHKFRKTLVFILVTGVVGYSSLLIVGGGELPEIASDSLSNIQQSIFGEEAVRYGNRGWSDPFREYMYRYGWTQIKEYPFWGKGFMFSTAELVASMSYMDIDNDLRQSFEGIAALAMAGGYHNAVFELMVFCGIPVTILFVVAYFGIFIQFLKWCYPLPNISIKVFSAGLAGYFVQASGQMLMNGSGVMFGQICFMLGIMSGLMISDQHQPEPFMTNNSGGR